MPESQQYELCDPRGVRTNRGRFRRDVIPLLERVTSFYCPTGRWPARGWILLPQYEYTNINLYSPKFILTIGDPNSPNNVQPLNYLSIVQAQCVTRGPATDPNALYLIELTDPRGLLYNKWFQFPAVVTGITGSTVAAYNIRAPAYPQSFYPWSMNVVLGIPVPWTWATMLQDMWNQMITFLGPWPGFPVGIAPLGTPEGFWMPGVPMWTAFNDILESLGMVVACDLTNITNPYTIVSAGANDNNFLLLQEKYAANIEDDQEWIDVGAGRVPASVVVLFRRRNAAYGTEETVRPDWPYAWAASPYYAVTVPIAFSPAVGVHYLWCDFTVEYDENSTPVPADVLTANSIAVERVAQYFAKIYRQTLGFMSQTYAGALPFVTGSMVDGVCYRQDYANQNRQGWKTGIVRGPRPPWVGLWDDYIV